MYLKEFYKGYYCITQSDNELYFNDIRFGQIGGWDKPDSSFVFSFKLAKNADNGNALNRNKLKVSYREAIVSLYERIRASPPTPLQKRGEK
jgi:inner membrane protein